MAKDLLEKINEINVNQDNPKKRFQIMEEVFRGLDEEEYRLEKL